MSRSRIKKAAVRLGYGLGLGRVATRLADGWTLHTGGRVPILRRRTDSSFLVLRYHRVNASAGRYMIETTSTEDFDRQMAYLARHFEVLALNEILDRLRSASALPRRCLTITFDDGYEDNYQHAFPILRRYGLPATVFLTVGSLDGGETLWFDRVLYAFRVTTSRSLELDDGKLALSFPTGPEKARAAARALEFLKKLPGQVRRERVEQLVEQLCGEAPQAVPNEMLRWSQVREMAQGGIDFGSHTLHHPILTRIPIEQAEHEIVESKRLIEERLGRPVRTFAYPNGQREDYSEKIKGLVRSAGYDAAFTTIQGENAPRDDLYELKRIRPFGRRLPDFAASMTYHYLVSGTST